MSNEVKENILSEAMESPVSADAPLNAISPPEKEESVKVGAAFAATRKHYREKGFEEGYLEAKRELDAQAPRVPPPAPSTYETPAPAAPSSPMSDVQFQQKVAAVSHQSKAESLRRQMEEDYPDYGDKVEDFLKEARNDYDQGNPDLVNLAGTLVDIGNSDYLYKIVADPTLREKVLAHNPRHWRRVLKGYLKEESPAEDVYHPQRMMVKTTLSPPLDEIKNSSSPGTTGMSDLERDRAKNRAARKLFRGL